MVKAVHLDSIVLIVLHVYNTAHLMKNLDYTIASRTSWYGNEIYHVHCRTQPCERPNWAY